MPSLEKIIEIDSLSEKVIKLNNSINKKLSLDISLEESTEIYMENILDNKNYFLKTLDDIKNEIGKIPKNSSFFKRKQWGKEKENIYSKIEGLYNSTLLERNNILESQNEKNIAVMKRFENMKNLMKSVTEKDILDIGSQLEMMGTYEEINSKEILQGYIFENIIGKLYEWFIFKVNKLN